MLTVLAFLLALGVLIAVHEYGHYRVAVACGVRVLRFSVGFGHVLWRWQPKGSPTEFVLGAFPIGGYVKMLDEREAPVAEHERHQAFNTQPLRKRAAIVAAGPLTNLLLAIVLYAIVNWSGTFGSLQKTPQMWFTPRMPERACASDTSTIRWFLRSCAWAALPCRPSQTCGVRACCAGCNGSWPACKSRWWSTWSTLQPIWSL